MKFCIFNSFPFHHEMFAYVLDYFKERGLAIDIYTNTINNYGWLDFYEKQFGSVLWFPISFFNPETYDYIFLLTDDDPKYLHFWNDMTRVIVVEHSGERQLNLRPYFTLQTRQFKLRNPPSDPNTWVLPVWNNILNEKFEKLTVLSIGSSSNKINLKMLFLNFSEIDFILVDRRMNIDQDSPNIKGYKCLDSSKLIEFAAKSHYIIFWPTCEITQGHQYNTISGTYPLAYSVGTPLLLPESFIDPLGLEGILGLPDTPTHLEKPSDALVSAFLNQRDALLKRRNYIFDSFIQQSQ